MSIWVCKPDGALQCYKMLGESLDDARRDLAMRIGQENILNAEQLSRPVIALCGAPSGIMNAFEITELGHYILFHGFVGPGLFSECDPQVKLSARIAQDTAADLADVLESTKATSVRANPVLVRELVGRKVRVYEYGDVVSGDFVDGRVNIVKLQGRIQDIWFG